MKKNNNNSVAMTSKLLAGLSIVAGLGALPAYAMDVNKAAVDVNVKEVTASVYEKDGHYYAKLVADKEVSNVNVRIVAENKAEFTIKRDLIKAGEVVEVELDFNAAVAKKRLPNTATVKKDISTTSQAGTHTFTITGSYEVFEKEDAESNPKGANTLDKVVGENGGSQDATPAPKTEEPKQDSSKGKEKVDKDETPTVNFNDIVNSGTTETPKEEAKPTTVAPKNEELKNEETAPKNEETPAQPGKVDKDETPTVNLNDIVNSNATEVPSTPKEEVKPATPTPVANNNTSSNAGVSLLKAPANAPKAPAQPTTKTLPTKAETPAPAATTTATSTATTSEEAIAKEFLRQLNDFRVQNGLQPLAENAQLNAATKNRAATVAQTGVTAAVHGPNGSYETNAAKAQGYNKGILYNVVSVSNSGTPEHVASRMLDELFSERNNVVSAYPYGHRNTLLSKTATEAGAGVAINGGLVSLVQHQNHVGAFDGKTPTKAIAPKAY